MRVGVLGCGTISDIYLQNLTTKLDGASVVACSDVLPAAAQKAAEKWNICALEPEELLCSPDVDCVLLLTPPTTHYGLGMQVLDNESICTRRSLLP